VVEGKRLLCSLIKYSCGRKKSVWKKKGEEMFLRSRVCDRLDVEERLF